MADVAATEVGRAARRWSLLIMLWERFGVYALLLIVVTAWAGAFVAARALLTPQPGGGAVLTPTLLATARFILASILFVPVLVWLRRRGQGVRLRDAPLFLLLGQLSISVYFLLQYTGVKLTNAGIAAVAVIGPLPLATLLVSRLMLSERASLKRTLAVITGAAGVVIVASQRGLHVEASNGFLLGIACLVANAISFAVYSSLIRGLRSRYPPLTTTAGMTLGGTLGLVLLALVTEDWRPLAVLTLGQWAALGYLGLLCSVVAYFLYNYALTRIDASRAATFIYLEPPIALALGAVLLHEEITAPTLIGGAIIMASVLLSTRL